MRKVFWENPYLHTLKTKVAFIDGCKILFEETIVYSENGGQESDKGTINGIPIIHSIKDDNENLIYYFLPDGHGLKVGDEVEMKIDWERRYRLMRLHFACEIILELVTQNFMKKQNNTINNKEEKQAIDKDKPKFEVGEKTGAHMHDDKARIDFQCLDNINAIFDWILKEYNEIIKSNRKIELGYIDIKTQKRFWKIDGFGQVPCGGTHVRTTAEVGYVKLKRERARKGEERIVIYPVDNSVPSCTLFAYKEFKPLLPMGLKYIRINTRGICLNEAAALFLRKSSTEIRKNIANYLRENIQEARSILEKIMLINLEKKENISNSIKQLLHERLPDNFNFTATDKQGDSFFDSAAQALNEHYQSQKYTIKSLRKICYDYIVSNEHEWVKSALMHAENGEDGYKQYLKKIIFTADEIEQAKSNITGPSTLGRPEIEGKILCEILGMKIHLIQANNNGQDANSIRELLIEKDKTTQLEIAMCKGEYLDSKIIHIVQNGLHCVPLVKNHTLSTNLSETDVQQQISLFEEGYTWPEIFELDLLSLTSKKMIVIITPGGLQIINELKFPESEPIFVFSNKHNHYDGISMSDDVNQKQVLAELKKTLPLVNYIQFEQTQSPKVYTK